LPGRIDPGIDVTALRQAAIYLNRPAQRESRARARTWKTKRTPAPPRSGAALGSIAGMNRGGLEHRVQKSRAVQNIFFSSKGTSGLTEDSIYGPTTNNRTCRLGPLSLHI
jgi:hypothetical protein